MTADINAENNADIHADKTLIRRKFSGVPQGGTKGRQSPNTIINIGRQLALFIDA